MGKKYAPSLGPSIGPSIRWSIHPPIHLFVTNSKILQKVKSIANVNKSHPLNEKKILKKNCIFIAASLFVQTCFSITQKFMQYVKGWVVLGGLGHRWVVMLDRRAILATVYRLFGWFWGVWGFDGWLSLIVGPFGPQCRQFG